MWDVIEFNHIFSLCLAVLWLAIIRLIPIKPAKIILRDRVRLTLAYPSDSFMCLTILRTLLFSHILFICYRVASNDNTVVIIFLNSIQWIYVAILLLFVILIVYLLMIYICNRIYQKELNACATVEINYEPIINADLSMDNVQWSQYNNDIKRQILSKNRIALDIIAMLMFMLTITEYIFYYK